MGAALTLVEIEPGHFGLEKIGKIAELCKSLGYKAAAAKNPKLLPIFASFWEDSLEVVDDLLINLEDHQKSKVICENFASIVQKRLEWLGEKLGKGSTQELKNLLKELGLG